MFGNPVAGQFPHAENWEIMPQDWYRLSLLRVTSGRNMRSMALRELKAAIDEADRVFAVK
jgi:hypothetical protein